MFGIFKTFNGLPPGALPPDEPIYTIPPIEWAPEISLRADKLTESRDWGHTNLGLIPLHSKGIYGGDVLVTICDTGIDVNHPDLKNNIVSMGHKDFTGSPSGFMDRQGHGTHCAGISASSLNNDGLIGAAPKAALLAVKVLGDNGSGASSWIAAGIRYAADTGADIISLSLGGPQPDQLTLDAINYAASKGCWIVCAAGNDGGPATSYPGHYPFAIAVAATDENNVRARFSTVNSQNDISAPGVSIMSTLPNSRYGTMSGTSMATPYVAGCLALVRGELKSRGKAIPSQSVILQLFKTTATDLSPTGHDSNTGWGLINPTRMIESLVGAPPVPTPPPDPTPIPNPPPTPVPPQPPMPLPAERVPGGLILGTSQVSFVANFKEGETFTNDVKGAARRTDAIGSGNELKERMELAGINFFQLLVEYHSLAVDPSLILMDFLLLFAAWKRGDMEDVFKYALKLLRDLGIKLPGFPIL